jgi:hypothetical protein
MVFAADIKLASQYSALTGLKIIVADLYIIHRLHLGTMRLVCAFSLDAVCNDDVN